MHKAEIHRQLQMNFPGGGECSEGSSSGQGADVYCRDSRRVSQQWLSGCRKERALTRDLMDQVSDLSNLVAAQRQVVKNGGSAGIDGMSTNELKEWFSHHHRSLKKSLQEGTYQPQAVREVQIPKPKGVTES